jgi:preprotein translocase subunit SecE
MSTTNQSKTANQPKAAKPKSKLNPVLFKEIRSELRRVTWPTKSELINYTVIVLVTCAFFAVTMGLLDAVFHFGLMTLLK